jgi:hypothetical protein
MSYRTNKLLHPSNSVQIETPLLIPSFSSKGFIRSAETGASDNGEYKSGLHRQYEVMREYITDTVLVSAYDIAQGYFPSPSEIKSYVELLFLDSGGYEISDDTDLSDVSEPDTHGREWSEAQYRKVLAAWPKELASVFVSYDNQTERLPLEDQISRANSLFSDHRHQMTTFLIKPETKDQRTLREPLAKLFGDASNLSSFNIIGLTEKEVGKSPKERMVNIGKLRRAMDHAGLQNRPIHVFGALDPLSTILYFMAGAEIFDGLTWLRYAYSEGRCIYTHNHGPVNFGIEHRDDKTRAITQVENVRTLKRIEYMLKEFKHTRNFSKLTKLGAWTGAEKFFADAYESLDSELNPRT